MALTEGTSSFWNHGLIISDVVPFTRIELIRRCLFVLRIGFRRIKPAIHYFPSGIVSFLVAKIRPARALICVYIGLRSRASWTRTQSVSLCSWTGESLWKGSLASFRETLPFIRSWIVPLGTPQSRQALRTDRPFPTSASTLWISSSVYEGFIAGSKRVQNLESIY
jgi:hypothetical protein